METGVVVDADEVPDEVRVLRDHRLLEEEGPVGLEQRSHPLGVGEGEPAVEVDRDVAVVAEHLTGSGHALDDAVDLGDGGDRAHPPRRVHLHRRQAGLDLLADVVGDLRRLVATDPAVDADPVADRAAEQLVHGRAVTLAGDVPQRLVDPGDRARQDRPAPVERALGHDLPVVLDAQRVPADDHLAQLLDGGAHGLGPALAGGLAPADDPALGLDADEQPAGRDEERLDPRDACHVAVSPSWRRR